MLTGARVCAIKRASRPGRPIISAKPNVVDINPRGNQEKRGGQLWFTGTDTAKDYLASCWKLARGPGAVHFVNELTEEYFKQLTAEYHAVKFKRGRNVSVWEKKSGDANEAGDLMVYNLAVAHHIGLHRRTENYWQNMRAKLNPANLDLLKVLEQVEQHGGAANTDSEVEAALAAD